MSTYRRVSISYHLFILLIVLQVGDSVRSDLLVRSDLHTMCDLQHIIFLFKCFGIENFAKADLKLTFNLEENQKHVTNSFTSRFVVGSLMFVVTVLVNYVFTRYYLEPFVCDKISEFVDFCSVSNVSSQMK